MKMNEVFCNTFAVMRHELGQDGVRDLRPLWERRLSTASVFCRSLVAGDWGEDGAERGEAEAAGRP